MHVFWSDGSLIPSRSWNLRHKRCSWVWWDLLYGYESKRCAVWGGLVCWSFFHKCHLKSFRRLWTRDTCFFRLAGSVKHLWQKSHLISAQPNNSVRFSSARNCDWISFLSLWAENWWILRALRCGNILWHMPHMKSEQLWTYSCLTRSLRFEKCWLHLLHGKPFLPLWAAETCVIRFFRLANELPQIWHWLFSIFLVAWTW